MKLLVIGLDCAVPQLLLGNDRLTNIRHIMAAGIYGPLESVVPPITVPAWHCMATSQDPGSLGIYGFRNRVDYSYDRLATVDSRSSRALTIWDQIARQGGRSNVVAVPPNYPPRRINGISIGCFLTPDAPGVRFVEPESIQRELTQRFGYYPTDVRGFRTDDKSWLRAQIYEMSRKHFEVVRYLLRTTEWDYFQFVEIGLDRMQHGFWKHHDPTHLLHPAETPFADTITEYYRYLDDEIGSVLECLSEDTAVLVVSDHGAQRLDGGFCINQWLVEQGWLCLGHQPKEITPFGKADVDWARTRVWSEGGYYARIFFNVAGREPQGAIEPAKYENFRDEVKSALESIAGPDGKPLGTTVFKPEEIYANVRGIAPDLIVFFGGLFWRSIGGIGYSSLHVQENDTGPDDCNHAPLGAFALAASNCPAENEIQGARLIDIAPTLLEIGGYDIPDSMQGRSLVKRSGSTTQPETNQADLEALTRERLRGLGYLG